MLDATRLELALDMQQRSYRLLKWLADAVRQGTFRFASVHSFVSFAEGASSWLSENLELLPPDARPTRRDVLVFANFLSTYLENSFDFDAAPGRRLYSPEAHCFCPLCSWFIDAPNLTTKRVTTSDKRRADHMRRNAVRALAGELDVAVTDAQVDELLSDGEGRECASLLAYGRDLLGRLEGVANGPAVLALWRSFAWERAGSPKPAFRLTTARILEAEAELTRRWRRSDASLSG